MFSFSDMCLLPRSRCAFQSCNHIWSLTCGVAAFRPVFGHAAFAVPGSLCKFTHVDAKTRGQTRVSTGYARTSIKKGTHLADACPQKEDIECTLALV